MSTRNLAALLRPSSVAVIGASRDPRSVGAGVLRNLVAAGFQGKIYAVNPHPIEVAGAEWVAGAAQLPGGCDMAVVATPAATVPPVTAELGSVGCKVAIVLSGGVTQANGLRQAMLEAARPTLLRIVGPNCLGALMPHARLNASFAQAPVAAGKLALISQSGALTTAMIDWANARGIGFSGLVSIGDMADVDFGDLIDLFAADPHTRAILLYVEGVTNPAKFISAARAASRIKPVIAIKGGRSEGARTATLSHTGALAGSWEVYRTVFERAGIVTVDTLEELFDAAAVLADVAVPDGDRLAIVTNGGGAGILAVDALAGGAGELAQLSEATLAALDTVLPPAWSHGDPVDLIGDADPERYRAALRLVAGDPGVDAVLVMNCPTALSPGAEIAAAVADEAACSSQDKPVLACWLGDTNAAAARAALEKARIPLLASPEDAVRAFQHLLAARRVSAARPRASAPVNAAYEPERARAIFARARRDGRTCLTEVEAKDVLHAYGIPVAKTLVAKTVEEVADCCRELVTPYAVKILSPQITHKSDVGGVALDLADEEAAVAAARCMAARVAIRAPHATISGFAVEQMVRRPNAKELIAGIADDPTFGAVLMVGAGGTAVEVLRDRAMGLPPLDPELAAAMVRQTRVSKLLAGYRDQLPADMDALCACLVALSQMAIDLPELRELDINPLLCDADGVMALDARIIVSARADERPRLSICPAPREWTADLLTRSGIRLHVRPVVPEDHDLLADFFEHVSPEDRRFRFLSSLRAIGEDRLVALTQLDYARTMHFLAFEPGGMLVGSALVSADPDRERAEAAISVHADYKNRGIGWTLLAHIERYARAQGIKRLQSIENADNRAAITIEQERGFTVRADPDDPATLLATRELQGGA